MNIIQRAWYDRLDPDICFVDCPYCKNESRHKAPKSGGGLNRTWKNCGEKTTI